MWFGVVEKRKSKPWKRFILPVVPEWEWNRLVGFFSEFTSNKLGGRYLGSKWSPWPLGSEEILGLFMEVEIETEGKDKDKDEE